MRILEMRLKKGYAKVVPETLDDLWHLYNIIYPGDQVHGRTKREVKIQTTEYSRPESRRQTVYLGLKAERIVWDKALNRLRVLGEITDIPEEFGGRGAHHTLNVVPGEPIAITKPRWLKHQVDRLEKASHVATPLVILAAIDDEEFAVAVVRQYGLDLKGEKRVQIPGKLDAERRDEVIKGYFKEALSLLRETWNSLKCPIVVLGLGFVKDGFIKYVRDMAQDVSSAIVDVKSVNSSGVTAFNEALRSGILSKTLKNARVAEETRQVEEVLTRLGVGKTDIAYGLDEVKKATEYGAVDRLLILDSMIRESPDEKRTELEALMRQVEEKGGQITVVSIEHEAGQKLEGLGGAAALLRFQIG